MQPSLSSRYRIVVPSKGRPGFMAHVLALMPDALVTVEDSELADYQSVVPAAQLLPHPPLDGMGPIRQWVLDQVDSEVIVYVDDDVLRVRMLVGKSKSRTSTDPQDVRRIIESTITVAVDLNVKMFGWAYGNASYFRNDKPFRFCYFLKGAWGVVGRDYRLSPEAVIAEDMDLCMTNLWKNRVVMCDRRYYFQFGVMMKEPGGLQSVRTKDTSTASLQWLVKKWGNSVTINRGKKPKRGTEVLRMNIKRTSPEALYPDPSERN